MSILGMLHLSLRPYRFCPVCGRPMGRNARKNTLGMHVGRDRETFCDGDKVPWKTLPVPTWEQWSAYWRNAEAERLKRLA